MRFQFKPDVRKETVNKTVRFPKELVEKIEKQVNESDSYFSSFVIQACEFAVRESEEAFKYKSDEK